MKDLIPYITNILEVIFASKWRALAVTLMAVVVLFGSIVWEKRDALVLRLFPEDIAVSLNKELFEKRAPSYLRQAKANVALLIRVQLERNQRTVEVIQTRLQGRATEYEGTTTAVFTHNVEENQYLIRLLTGDVFCNELIAATEIGAELQAKGITTICRVGILEDGLLVGYIQVGYAIPPENEALMITSLRTFSSGLIKN